jgi:hypothetical protein
MTSPNAPPRAPGELADELERRFADERYGFADLAIFTKACLPDIIAALRAPQGDGAEAMREACLKAALGACYGPPSSWPGDYPKGWRHPPSWEPDEKPTPTIAAWHDNGARDAWFAIRALDRHSLTKNQGGQP